MSDIQELLQQLQFVRFNPIYQLIWCITSVCTEPLQVHSHVGCSICNHSSACSSSQMGHHPILILLKEHFWMKSCPEVGQCGPRHHGPQAHDASTSISGFSSQIISTPSPQKTYGHYQGHHGKPTVYENRCPDMCHHAYNNFIPHHLTKVKPTLYIDTATVLSTQTAISYPFSSSAA